jgi:hypothetical protein
MVCEKEIGRKIAQREKEREREEQEDVESCISESFVISTGHVVCKSVVANINNT